MTRAVTGLFDSQGQAQQAIRDLKAAGFAEGDIGVVMPSEITPVAEQNSGDRSGEGAVAGGILGGTLGAILAATGALVIPGIGPFITGGILAALLGGATGWLVGGLVGLGVPKEEATYYEEQVHSGRALVAVRAGERSGDVRRLLAANGGEIDRPASATPVAASSQAARTLAPVSNPASGTHEPRTLAPTTNLAQDSGQFADMMHTTSDDGTVPPTAHREAITTGTDGAHDYTRQRADFFVAKPGLSPDVRTTDQIGPDVQGAGDARKLPADGIAPHPPAAGKGNPAPLSPADPRRETDEGQPYLDDANPYGRFIPNRQDETLGGVATQPDPVPAERARTQGAGGTQEPERP